MATGKALNGKPYAGNPHVRFDEGEVAPAATPRRGSLLYNESMQNILTNDARERLVALDAECRESSAYERFIDNLDCSAKVKSVLRELAKKTAYVGGRVIRIGKIALDFTIKALGEACRRFPNVACAILILLILKALISLVPFIGPILAGLLTPIFLTVLVGVGLAKDVLEMVRPVVQRHFGRSAGAAR